MEVAKHTPGMFCWSELGASDHQAAKKFYSELFGWSANDVPIGPDSFYSMMRLRGKDVVAISQLSQERLTQGIPPHWLSYIAVESVDKTAIAIKAAGGKIMMDPFDVFNEGRMTVAQDPTGAIFGIWQARNHIGAQINNEVNALCWHELITRDAAASSDFYSRVFGWKPRPRLNMPMACMEFLLNGQAAGGMFTLLPEMVDLPPHWMTYFAADDCDAKVKQARSLGAKVITPPQDISNIGRYATVADPQGTVFSIIKLNHLS